MGSWFPLKNARRSQKTFVSKLFGKKILTEVDAFDRNMFFYILLTIG